MSNIQKHIKDGIINELKVEGNSMFPTIKSQENIKISPLDNKLILGALYVFNYRSKIIIHRLLKKNGNNCIFIGDNTSTIHHIKYDDILGKATLKENRYYLVLVMLLNNILYNRKKDFFIFNGLRIKLIRLFYLFTHWGEK